MKKLTSPKRSGIVIAIIAIAMLFIMTTGAVYADGPSVTNHTKQEIINYLKSNGATVSDPVSFATMPVKNNIKGELSSTTKESAREMLNSMRYIAGLNEVSLDSTQGSKAQAAAFSNWVIGELTHYPGTTNGEEDGPTRSKPDGMSDTVWNDGITGARNSNIAYGRNTINDTIVFGWMADSSSASNVKKVGHRRWCLNPAMGKTGFGATTGSSYLDKYYAMWSMDESGSGSQKNVVWPAQKMPIEFFGSNIPWSLSTGNTGITNISNVSVQLTRRSSSPSGAASWSFSTSKTYTAASTGEYFGVAINNNPYSGQRGPYVVFRPANITYKSGDIFDVSITGLGSNTISYTVEFFSGYPVESFNFDKEQYVLTSSSYTTINTTVTPATAANYEIEWSTDDPSVASVDESGRLTRVSPGTTTVRGIIDGRYTSSGNAITVTAQVFVPKSISSDDITVDIKTPLQQGYPVLYYNGKAQHPDVEIKDGGKKLIENVDYEWWYPSDPIEPANILYQGYAKGIGNYYGQRFISYIWIQKRSIDSSMISFDNDELIYNGLAQRPVVTVNNEDLTLEENTDYTVAYSGGTNAGTYTLTVKTVSGNSHYQGSATKTFKILPKTVSDSMVSLNSSTLTYNGANQTPDVNVKDGNKTLQVNTDYTLSYSNNINAGTATVTVTGKGNYTGSVNKNFTINAKPLDEGMVTIDKTSIVFNGQNQKPTVTVKDGSKNLTEGTDYTLTNEGGTNANTYTISVVGKGNYSGTIYKNFTITKKELSEDMISFSDSSFTYNGELQKPSQVTVKFGSISLTAGNEYTLTNEGGIDAGDYTFVVAAKSNGNYSGSVTKNYTIAKKAITEDMLTLSSTSFKYNGSNQKPTPTVMDGSKAIANEDYDLTNDGGINTGSYTVILSGKRNYSGSVSKTYTITAKGIDDSDITVDDLQDVVYTGSAQTPAVTVQHGTNNLSSGADFTVSYTDNVNVGEAKVTINGKGNFTGQRAVAFNITGKSIAATDVIADDIPNQVLEDTPVKPVPAIRYNGKTLTADDFDLSYEDNDAEGTGKVTVTGKGNFTGVKDLEYNIISRERAELIYFIATLEQDRDAELDEDFKTAISAALDAARAVAENPEANTDDLTAALTTAQNARETAQAALQQKKDAEEQAKAEAEAKKKAEEEAQKAAAAARAKQKGSDGTAIGAGASAECAEKAILASASDEGPKGSKYAPLTLKSTAQTNTSVTLTWTKSSKAKKYVIYGNACGKNNKLKKLKTVTGKSCKITKISKTLKKGTYHKFMIVALNANNNVVSTSKVIHVATKGGKVGNHKSVTIKAKVNKNGKAIKSYKALTATKIKKGKSVVIKTSLTPVSKKLAVKKHRIVCYESSNVKIATVNAKGKIVAKKKGTCYIFAYAQNGVSKKLKITVY